MTKPDDIGCGGRRRRRAVPPLDSFVPEGPPPRRVCDHPDCEREALYRAPKDRSLSSYYWFCLEHVQQYNKAWNYYAGMSETDIERDIRLSACWDRPTWPLGRNPAWDGPMDASRFRDPLGLFSEDDGPARADDKSRRASPPREDGPRARALRVMDLDEPVSLADLKDRYKALCKMYHPDANGGDKDAEERFKMVNEAYHILVAALTTV